MAGRTHAQDLYRFGFNGKENDGETGTQDYGMRIYNPALGRFLSVDPITKDYPFYTPYQFAGNIPIQYIDIDGLEPGPPAQSNINKYDYKSYMTGPISSLTLPPPLDVSVATAQEVFDRFLFAINYAAQNNGIISVSEHFKNIPAGGIAGTIYMRSPIPESNRWTYYTANTGYIEPVPGPVPGDETTLPILTASFTFNPGADEKINVITGQRVDVTGISAILPLVSVTSLASSGAIEAGAATKADCGIGTVTMSFGTGITLSNINYSDSKAGYHDMSGSRMVEVMENQVNNSLRAGDHNWTLQQKGSGTFDTTTPPAHRFTRIDYDSGLGSVDVKSTGLKLEK